MKRWCIRLAVAVGAMTATGVFGQSDPVRGADELFWVPTLEQGLAMAQATGKPLFLMGYSLVGDGTTYTQLDAGFCRGVF